MDFLNTTIREAELAKVPMVNENGITETGKNKFSIGSKIRLAPPPQMALTQNAITVTKKRRMIFNAILTS